MVIESPLPPEHILCIYDLYIYWFYFLQFLEILSRSPIDAIVTTRDVPNYNGSLYDNILRTYPNLMPISIQNVNRVMTQIK